MELIRFFTHYGMHFLVPGAIAFIFFNNKWKKVWLLFIMTMLIDLDHLIAQPIFDAQRCSIDFHPLHSYYAMLIYLAFLVFPKTRIIGIALLFHMLSDCIDCLWVN